MNELESPQAAREQAEFLAAQHPKVASAAAAFNALDWQDRARFRQCDVCAKLVVYAGGSFLDTGMRRVPGTRRWCCFACAALCPCGDWIHPRNRAALHDKHRSNTNASPRWQAALTHALEHGAVTTL
jgi:hypothetical protein